MSAARAFDDLTPRGQLGRLRTLAFAALREYDLEVVRCRFVAQAFNTVFRVDAANGSTYAFRISPHLRIHADGCELAEAEWLTALRRDATSSVPQVIRTRDRSVVVTAAAAGVPQARTCVLFEWTAGRPLRERTSVNLVHKVGALTAIVHEHGAFWAATRPPGPPSGVLVADCVLYFRAARRLDELRPTYGSVLAEAADRTQRALDDLWRNPPHRPHLLHGDVQPGNVLAAHGEVTLIDFQDLIWGFEIQDALIAVDALAPLDNGPRLVDAFRRGYETVRPWPDADRGTVEALTAARHLNILNFGLNVRRPDLERFVARHAGPVVEWMRG
ncbi:MAG: phosphotransferase enzyme family protein [Acidimicrobiia bacterium]